MTAQQFVARAVLATSAVLGVMLAAYVVYSLPFPFDAIVALAVGVMLARAAQHA